MKTIFITLTLLLSSLFIYAENIKLPAPNKTGGKSLMDCLNERQTNRNFDTKKLSLQDLSDLTWATWGINRSNGRRTVPTATNWQEMELYVALEEGVYKYNAETLELELVKKGDFRKDCGTQPFVANVPVCFIYVANHTKEGAIKDPQDQKLYSYNHVGYMSQNAYLVCASKDMATVILGMVDKEALAKTIGLPEKHIVIFTQPIGYKK